MSDLDALVFAIALLLCLFGPRWRLDVRFNHPKERPPMPIPVEFKALIDAAAAEYAQAVADKTASDQAAAAATAQAATLQTQLDAANATIAQLQADVQTDVADSETYLANAFGLADPNAPPPSTASDDSAPLPQDRALSN